MKIESFFYGFTFTAEDNDDRLWLEKLVQDTLDVENMSIAIDRNKLKNIEVVSIEV